MQKTLLIILLLCFSYFVKAQKIEKTEEEQKVYVKKLKEVEKMAMKLKSKTMLDDFVKENPTETAYEYAYYNASKTNVLSSIQKKVIFNNDENEVISPKKQLIVNEILGYFQKSIDTCKRCSINSRISRCKFLEKTGTNKILYQTEYKLLKSAGYKKDFSHPDISLLFSYTNSPWIGVSVAPIRYFQPSYSIRDVNEAGQKFVAKREFGSSISFLPVSYQYNFANRIYDFNVSLFQLNGPLHLDVTKFGSWQNASKGTSTIYYRPEIGLGSAFFSVNYGRNYALTNRGENTIDKHIFTARFSMWAQTTEQYF